MTFWPSFVFIFALHSALGSSWFLACSTDVSQHIWGVMVVCWNLAFGRSNAQQHSRMGEQIQKHFFQKSRLL